ncbi:hypothetical protein LCGC14_1580060 [marine sediment metagenome]|uniref:Lipoprotein n=1 Tax=marine sediment metagenome TaxID=412755 RepID=A0A0F9J388_9ZZZZ
MKQHQSMKNLILLLVLVLGGCAHSDQWSKRDTYMQLGVTAALAADAYTTSKIQYDLLIYERGFLASRALGRQPSTRDTYVYFGTLIIGNYLISRALPAKWRPYWQGWEMSVHGYVAYKNCKMGLGCDKEPLFSRYNTGD